MKIMMLTGAMDSGGAQTHVFELIKGLLERGHSIILVSGGGEMAQELSVLGVECHCVKTDTSHPVSLVGALIALRALIIRKSPDIVHAHTRPFGILCRMLSPLFSGTSTSFVSTVHAKFSTDRLYKRISWYSGDVIAVGEDLKQHLLSLSRGTLLPERIRVIPNGVDIRRFCPTRQRSDRHRFKLCFMSRLDEDCSETAYILCRLAPRICDMIYGADIYIIGGGSELEALRVLADTVNRGIGYRAIRVLGRIYTPEIILSSCDLFVGVSRAAIEAMSCGIPVILSGNEGFGGLITSESELLSAELSNFCCRGMDDPCDDLLMSAISEFYYMPSEERASIGRLMRHFAVTRHSSAHMAKQTEAFYNDVLRRVKGEDESILLCGYYGFGNMGDDALLERSIAKAKGCGVTVMAKAPKRTSFKFGVRCVNRSNPFAVLWEIKKSSALVFGGGSLLQSRTSLRSLLWYASVFLCAHSQGKRTELWANGIGPLKGGFSEMIAARVLRSADRIGLRDVGSVKLAIKLAPDSSARIILEEDLALSCPTACDRRLDHLLFTVGIKNGDRFAIISVKGFSPSVLLSPTKTKRARLEYTKLCKALRSLRLNGIQPIFILSHPKQDGAATRRLCSRYGGKMLEDIGISDLSALTAHATAVISMRYHPLLLSKKHSVPFIAIGDDPKIISIAEKTTPLDKFRVL